MRKINIRANETSENLRNLYLPVDLTLKSDRISEVLRSDGLAQKSLFISRVWLE